MNSDPNIHPRQNHQDDPSLPDELHAGQTAEEQEQSALPPVEGGAWVGGEQSLGREQTGDVRDAGETEKETGTVAPLPLRTLVRFWAPLAATWLMMSIESPILTAIIARLPNQELNLAAYGVAFHIGMLIEAPIIMILSATTALVRDGDSLLKLRNYTYTLNAVLTGLMLLIAFPPIFEPFAEHVLGLTPDIAQLAQIGVLCLTPWPAAIGFRRFYQGILISEGLTGRVAWGTVMRVVGMLTGATLLATGFDVAGIVVGTLGLSFAVTAEALAARYMVNGSMKRIRKIRPTGEPLTYKGITRFYYPLALTSIIGLGAPPAITFFLGRSVLPVESLAIWPVLSSFVFLFRSVGLAWQEGVIALVGDRLEQYRPARKFTIILAVTTTGLLALVAWSPLALLWFTEVAGLKPELAELAILPVRLMVLLPATPAILSLQRGVLVKLGRTGPISVATAIEVGVILLLLLLLIPHTGLIGVAVAAIAVMVGRLAANLYFLFPFLAGLRSVFGRSGKEAGT